VSPTPGLVGLNLTLTTMHSAVRKVAQFMLQQHDGHRRVRRAHGCGKRRRLGEQRVFGERVVALNDEPEEALRIAPDVAQGDRLVRAAVLCGVPG